MFRLWMIRRAHPLTQKFAYSPISVINEKASSLFLRRQRNGIASIRQMGKGREFEILP